MTRSDYEFTDYWHIDAPKNAVWRALEQYGDWSSWWRGLESVEMIEDTIGVGTRFICTWRGAAWYKLHLTLTITDYKHNSEIKFDSEGDLIGSGEFLLSEKNGSSIMMINWRVRTAKWWMNLFGPLLRPLFVSNHARIMNDGEQGLQNYMIRNGESNEKI